MVEEGVERNLPKISEKTLANINLDLKNTEKLAT